MPVAFAPELRSPVHAFRRLLFGGFDLFPVAQHGLRESSDRRVHIGVVAGRARSLVAKNMRMPADQFAVQMVEHIGDGEVALVGGHLRIEQHLQQQIAEFFGKMREVAALNGVEDFVGFFKRVFADGVEGLLAVPGAAAGSAQPRHNGRRLLKKLCCPRRIGLWFAAWDFAAGTLWRKIHAFPV